MVAASAAADRLARLPDAIEARGVRHNNLRDLDVDIPLWCVVVIAGVSGSGTSSLATGTLYAEGMQVAFPRGPVHLQPPHGAHGRAGAQRPDVDRIYPPARRAWRCASGCRSRGCAAPSAR